MCVCVYVRERERGEERFRGRDKESMFEEDIHPNRKAAGGLKGKTGE